MIPYGRQDIHEEDIAAVIDVLRGDWLTQGPTIEKFEEAVADYVQAEHAVAFSSGTAALHASAFAAGLGPGDLVYTSPLTFIASANAARYVGATPQLADIDPRTWNINLQLIPSTAAAAIPVHYGGLPVELAPSAWSYKPKVIIEDAAHALGAHTPYGPVGNCAHSDMTCFSFHPVKPITSGEGGMVTTNNSELAERLRRFRSHGIVRKPEKGDWYYEVEDTGYHYRMTDIQAALGLSQLTKIDSFISRRNELAQRYRALLADFPLQLPAAAPANTIHGYHLFAVLLDNRDRVFAELRRKGVGVQVHYVPVHHHPIMREHLDSSLSVPIADSVYSRILSLPLHPRLSESDQDTVVSVLAGALE